jgi:hypothetical protein
VRLLSNRRNYSTSTTRDCKGVAATLAQPGVNELITSEWPVIQQLLVSPRMSLALLEAIMVPSRDLATPCASRGLHEGSDLVQYLPACCR